MKCWRWRQSSTLFPWDKAEAKGLVYAVALLAMNWPVEVSKPVCGEQEKEAPLVAAGVVPDGELKTVRAKWGHHFGL